MVSGVIELSACVESEWCRVERRDFLCRRPVGATDCLSWVVLGSGDWGYYGLVPDVVVCLTL